MKCETTSISPEKSNYKIQSILYIILILYLSTIIPCQAKIIILKESVKVKHRIKSAQQKEIERDLREKAGLKSLRFDENGMLIFNKTEKPEKGSKKFRQLITGAIQDQNNIFEIVNYSNSGEFHFAKIDEGTTIALTENKGQRIVENGRVTIYRIMIDFADYKNSQRYSHKEVLQSHTIGITLFHEINHKVSYDLTDPIPAGGIRPDKSSSSIRGVIENTNTVRQELSLIIRDHNQHQCKTYRGYFYKYTGTLQITFLNSSGKQKFLRWKP